MEKTKSNFVKKPGTRLGWWSVGLAIVFMVMMAILSTNVMSPTMSDLWRRWLWPAYGISMMTCGVAALVVGLIAVIAKKERSWLVWLALFPGTFALFFVLGEFLFPH